MTPTTTTYTNTTYANVNVNFANGQFDPASGFSLHF
jgi:hypothetical protein